MDYIEIQQLVAKYPRAIDSCSNNGYDYADLFTADGVVLPIVGGKPITGDPGAREAGRGVGRRVARVQERGWIQQGVRHLYPNHVIRPRRTAPGHGGHADDRPGRRPQQDPARRHYEDAYVKTPQGWRFKQRTHHALLNGGQPAK